MSRYILVSSGSGYIVGDTADFAAGHQSDVNGPEEAARVLDEIIGEVANEYAIISVRAAIALDADGYYVYRSDVGGSDQMPTITDGTDQEMIDAVTRYCDFVGFVERHVAEKIGAPLPPRLAVTGGKYHFGG